MLALLQFAGGLALLLVGGKLLVDSSVDTARRLAVSALVVGLTLVAWGTSAPELALNLISASKGRGELAIGNIVGANICNMALVLGLCALVKPLVVQQRLIAIEIWLNAAMLIVFATLMLTLGPSRPLAAIMLACFGIYSVWTIVTAMRQSRSGPRPVPTPLAAEATDEPPPMGWTRIAIGLVVGLVLLSVGGSLASDGASAMAIGLGVPAAIVGVTVVSIGTTLPEMVTGVLAVRKGQTDLAMGNAIGSCLFNVGAIFGLVGLIAPTDASVVSPITLSLIYMAVLAGALVPISRTFGKTVSRLEGGVLLGTYVAFLVLSAVR
jgi:cation:H+ antiporter